MDLTPSRATRCLAALCSLTLLAACSTTVSGSGRPAAAGSGSGSRSGSASSGSDTPTGTASPFDADAADDAHTVWDDAIDASAATGGSVQVVGTISGAGVGGATIKAVYATGSDGNPVADVGIVTPDGGALEILATGGSAWAKAAAAVYEEYNYPDDDSVQAAGKQVELTDDDSGLDVYAALESFLDLCGPSDGDPATVEDGTYEGQDVLVVTDVKYATKAYVDPTTGHVIASVYDDETVTFRYGDTPLDVEPPADADVVTVPGF